jgi:integrase
MTARGPARQLAFAAVDPSWDGDRLADVEIGLVERMGLAASTAATRARTLDAALQQPDHDTLDGFLADPSALIAAIAAPRRGAARRARHLAIADAIAIRGAHLPAGAQESFERALEAYFPGRLSPKQHLVDLDLGGDRRGVRGRLLLLPPEVERLIEAIDPLNTRDRALLATLCGSGLRPAEVLALDWDQLVAMEATGTTDVWRIPRVGSGRDVPLNRTARDRLFTWHRQAGELGSGPVFMRGYGRPRRLSVSHARYVVDNACDVAGLPVPDLRHLRLHFALVLERRGWRDEAIARGFGFKQTFNFRRAVEPFRELRAQLRAAEVLSLPSASEAVGVGGSVGTAVIEEAL